MDYRSGHAWH